MNSISRYLTAIAFTLAGAAAHANAAVEQSSCGSATCFQLTPVADKNANAFLAQDGGSRTPQGKQLDSQTA